jgi:predicted aspartyl protease
VVLGRIQTSNGEWVSARLLIDTGADRTVLSASALSKLGFIPRESEEGISGLGGVTDAVVIPTKLQLFRETGAPVKPLYCRYRSHRARLERVRP